MTEPGFPKRLNCGRHARGELHGPHDWRCQVDDDSPAIETVQCAGFNGRNCPVHLIAEPCEICNAYIAAGL